MGPDRVRVRVRVRGSLDKVIPMGPDRHTGVHCRARRMGLINACALMALIDTQWALIDTQLFNVCGMIITVMVQWWYRNGTVMVQ